MRRGLAVAALAVAVLTGGCSDVDGEQDLDDVAEGVFTAAGVEEDRVSFELDTRASTACATELGIEPGRDEGQAFYARKAYGLAPGTYDLPVLHEQAVAYLEDDGWDVVEYTGVAGMRALTADKGELAVSVTTGGFNVLVTSGPCSRVLNVLGDRWQRVGD